MNDTALLDELAQLAAQRIGLGIPEDARERFAGILCEHATHLGYASLQDYRDFLTGNQTTVEWEYLARAFTTGETFFFRDHGQFDLMRLRLLPELIARHRSDKTLRLWSAGCASGEEAYSLAMLVDMLMPGRDGWDILILGTDINSEAIARARRGQYGKWSFRMIPPELQQRYFKPQSENWILDERIRRMVTFRASNLVAEPFPDPASELRNMDLILCRNVFIYFDPAAVSAVAKKFAATLREGGYLLTAHTELIGHPVQELESRLFVEGVVYQRRAPVPVPTTSIRRQQVREAFPPASLRTCEERHAPPASVAGGILPPAPALTAVPTPPPADEVLLRKARAHADRGDFEQAQQVCRKALAANPLSTATYFLLAQLAQVRGDSEQTTDCLNKAIYLDHRFVAAYLELATLHERARNMPRAHALRIAALGIVRTMPADAMIEQYETTAGDLRQWLEQWASESDHPAAHGAKS